MTTALNLMLAEMQAELVLRGEAISWLLRWETVPMTLIENSVGLVEKIYAILYFNPFIGLNAK